MKKILALLSDVIGFINQSIAATGIAAGVALAFYNAIARHVFNASLPLAAELTMYLFLWSTFFGAAYCFKEDAHIAIDIFIDKLSSKNVKKVMLFSHLISLIFLLAVSYYGYQYVILVHDLDERSIDLWNMPMWIPYLAIPVSFAFGAFRVAQKIGYMIKTPGDKIVKKSESEMLIAGIEGSAHEDLIKEVEKRTGGML